MKASRVDIGLLAAFFCGMLCAAPSVNRRRVSRRIRFTNQTRRSGRLSRRQALMVIAAVAGCLIVPGSSRGDGALDTQKTEQAESAASAATLVDQALRQEVIGNNLERARFLALARTKDPDNERVNWHGGKVKAEKNWIDYRDFPEHVSQQNPKLAEYWDRRTAASENVRIKGLKPDRVHRALAQYCQDEGLSKQARSHWFQVLLGDPDDHEARRALGFIKSPSGLWVTPEQMDLANAAIDRAQKNLGRWKSEMTAFRAKWFSNNERQRNEAKQSMEKFRDPSCIPAIEQVLAMHNEGAAQMAVELLGAIDDQEATIALIRLAVSSPSRQVALGAAEKLKSRDRFLYMEPLLGLMVSPIQMQVESFYDRCGKLTFRQIAVQEGRRLTDVSVVDTIVSQRWRKNYARSIVKAETSIMKRRIRNWQTNEQIKEFNYRIMDILSIATGEDSPKSPEQWWTWWQTENEVYTPDYRIYQRPSSTRYRVEHFEISCLAAGTPVMTDAGTKAIEDVQIGDCVLSQHPYTGELEYQPVLQTTIRPPEQLVQFTTGYEVSTLAQTICSGGHPFWVAGKGWVKARDLKEGNHIYCVSGTTPVNKVADGPKKESYNLVVDGTHNYFVGDSLMLSHDNTIHEPTGDLIVPGLAQ